MLGAIGNLVNKAVDTVVGGVGEAVGIGGAGGIGDMLGGLLGGGGTDILGGLLGGGGIGGIVNGLADSLGLPDWLGDIGGAAVDFFTGNIPGAIANASQALPDILGGVTSIVDNFKGVGGSIGDMFAGDLSNIAGDLGGKIFPGDQFGGPGQLLDTLSKGLSMLDQGFDQAVDVLTNPNFLEDMGVPPGLSDTASSVLKDAASDAKGLANLGADAVEDLVNSGIPQDAAESLIARAQHFGAAAQVAQDNPGLAQNLLGSLSGLNFSDAVDLSGFRSQFRA